MRVTVIYIFTTLNYSYIHGRNQKSPDSHEMNKRKLRGVTWHTLLGQRVVDTEEVLVEVKND